MSIKINCLSCGFRVELGEEYSEYEGQVTCFACGATLMVKLSEGYIKSVMMAEPVLKVDDPGTSHHHGKNRGPGKG